MSNHAHVHLWVSRGGGGGGEGESKQMWCSVWPQALAMFHFWFMLSVQWWLHQSVRSCPAICWRCRWKFWPWPAGMPAGGLAQLRHYAIQTGSQGLHVWQGCWPTNNAGQHIASCLASDRKWGWRVVCVVFVAAWLLLLVACLGSTKQCW